MTAPIQEPSTDRALQGIAYQRDQLLRRPAPVSATGDPDIWMYIQWGDGAVLPATDTFPFNWYTPPNYDVMVASQDAIDTGVLYPVTPNNDFRIYADPTAEDNLADGAVWVVSVNAVFNKASGGPDPVPGDFFAIGNLADAGEFIGNADFHEFAPADLLYTHARERAMELTTVRVHAGGALVPADYFFTAEVGNFCHGEDMRVMSMDMTVVMVGNGQQFLS